MSKELFQKMQAKHILKINCSWTYKIKFRLLLIIRMIDLNKLFVVIQKSKSIL